MLGDASDAKEFLWKCSWAMSSLSKGGTCAPSQIAKARAVRVRPVRCFEPKFFLGKELGFIEDNSSKCQRSLGHDQIRAGGSVRKLDIKIKNLEAQLKKLKELKRVENFIFLRKRIEHDRQEKLAYLYKQFPEYKKVRPERS